jgi:methionyl-tRNA formyltransferase
MQLTPPTIKLRAVAAGIPVLQPESLRKKSAIDAVAALSPDLIVVMAYGQILTERFLAIPLLGCINLHASLLPKYRGAACIQAAIDEGNECTGVTVMHMVRELDAGDIILQKTLPIREQETGGSLHDALAALAPAAMAEVLDMFASGRSPRMAQDAVLVSYVGKLSREDGRLSWNSSACALERRIRAYDPWPGTFTTMEHGLRVKVFPPVKVVEGIEIDPGTAEIHDHHLLVGCAEGALALSDIQIEGGKRMRAMDFARGHRDSIRFLSQ